MSHDINRTTNRTSKRLCKWQKLMKKFTDKHKIDCTCEYPEFDCSEYVEPQKEFPTQSLFEGNWTVLGIGGYGIYTFPNGVTYEGGFKDGMFHGSGEMRYPDGAVLRGHFVAGLTIEVALSFVDGLDYSTDNWFYCRVPDRRFYVEYDYFLQPHDISFLTNDQPTKNIPDGYYDCGTGFYDPKTKVIYKYDNIREIVRSPSLNEQEWIMRNCRKSGDVSVGPRAELYEQFVRPLIYLDESHHIHDFDFSVGASSDPEYEARWKAMRAQLSKHIRSVSPPRSQFKIEMIREDSFFHE